MFTIDNDVPIPPRSRHGGRGSKYLFGALAVGESFYVPDVKASTLRSAVGAYFKANPEIDYKYSVRQIDDGVRIWRIK